MDTCTRNLHESINAYNALLDIKKKQLHIGPGLYLTIGIGTGDDSPIELPLGASTDLDALLDTLIKCAEDRKNFWVKSTQKAVNEAKLALAAANINM